MCKKTHTGPFRESNPGPPAPKAGIIPLDQTDAVVAYVEVVANEESYNGCIG